MERIETRFELDMHYVGQTHTIAVTVPAVPEGETTGVSDAMIREAFEAAPERYAHRHHRTKQKENDQ